MTATSVLIHGELFKPPERATSKNGKTYTKMTLRVGDGDAVEWWSVLAFSETIGDELMELTAGERCAVQGTLKTSIYRERVQHSVFASAVLPLRQKKKRKTENTASPSPASSNTGTSKPTFDDQITF